MSTLLESSGFSALLLSHRTGQKPKPKTTWVLLCYSLSLQKGSVYECLWTSSRKKKPVSKTMDAISSADLLTLCTRGVTIWVFPAAELTQGHCHLLFPCPQGHCHLLSPCLSSTLDLEQECWCGVSFWLGLIPAVSRCQVKALPVFLGGYATVRMLWHLSNGFSLSGWLKSKISLIHFQSNWGFLRFQGHEKSDAYPLWCFRIVLTAFALCLDLMPSPSLSLEGLIEIIHVSVAARWKCHQHDMMKCRTG